MLRNTAGHEMLGVLVNRRGGRGKAVQG
jgi:hypothetical protein